MIGDDARVEMLTVLMADCPLTATELAGIAGESRVIAFTPPGEGAFRSLFEAPRVAALAR
jgi:hypothetical protein